MHCSERTPSNALISPSISQFGNTCYVNAVSQALYFCRPFREKLLEHYDALCKAPGFHGMAPVADSFDPHHNSPRSNNVTMTIPNHVHVFTRAQLMPSQQHYSPRWQPRFTKLRARRAKRAQLRRKRLSKNSNQTTNCFAALSTKMRRNFSIICSTRHQISSRRTRAGRPCRRRLCRHRQRHRRPRRPPRLYKTFSKAPWSTRPSARAARR